MQKDERDLLDVLKSELSFLEKGGYARSPNGRSRPLIFQDSPACMNYDMRQTPGSCEDCVLMQLMPPQSRRGNLPCYQIPLNAVGETLDSLYRHGEDTEIEETYHAWLRRVITRIEELTEVAAPSTELSRGPSACTLRGIALHENLHPKCANPDCLAAFHWLSGGRFFRFQGSRIWGALAEDNVISPPKDDRKSKNYWLCESCSRTYTLAYCKEHGVVIEVRRPAKSIRCLAMFKPASPSKESKQN